MRGLNYWLSLLVKLQLHNYGHLPVLVQLPDGTTAPVQAIRLGTADENAVLIETGNGR